MAALDSLSKTQFMPVADLMNTYSHDALGMKRHDVRAAGGDPSTVSHGEGTRMRDIYPLKAKHIAAGADDEHPDYKDLDPHLRSGSIDPILLGKTSGGDDEIIEGQHRIARAYQLGVQRLPVSRDPESQSHQFDWMF